MNQSFSIALLATLLAAPVLALAEDEPAAPKGPAGHEQARQRCKENPDRCREMMKRRAEEWFKKVDTDGDGSISRQEAEKNAPRLAKNFDAVDTNHDGKITPDELRAARKAAEERRRSDHGGEPKPQ